MMTKTIFCIFLLNAVFTLVAMGPSLGNSEPKHVLLSQLRAVGSNCNPTPSDYLGPYYKTGAPERASVGKGYELEGIVKSSADCAPVAKARIELWLTNSEGNYDDDHRATIYSDDTGAYYFKSNFPPGYSGRPPHIHIRISRSGFKTLATQYYPEPGNTTGVFDIVLVPAR